MFDRIVDEIIREAMEAGEFDNLPGKGKPINHDEYFSLPADRRLGYSALKSAGFVPEEVALLKEIEGLAEGIRTGGDEATVSRLKRKLRDARLELSIMLERRKLRR